MGKPSNEPECRWSSTGFHQYEYKGESWYHGICYEVWQCSACYNTKEVPKEGMPTVDSWRNGQEWTISYTDSHGRPVNNPFGKHGRGRRGG